MNKQQFIARLKRIYHSTKRQPVDSSLDDLRDVFLKEVIAKSNGSWDESVASQTMGFIENIFNVQPEATQLARHITSDDAEATLKQFLADRDCMYNHIPESQDRSPDGYINYDNNKYLCELKSPVLMFDHTAAPFGYKFKTTHSKILNAIHEARNQFAKHDPNHTLPHILAYTSAVPQLDYNSFVDAIRGYRASASGEIEVDFRETEIFQSTKDIIGDIDLYAFFRISSSKKFIRVVYFTNKKSTYSDEISKLVHELRNSPVSSMDGCVDLKQL